MGGGLWRGMVACALALPCLACDSAPDGDASLPPRWVSHYTGGERTWVPEESVRPAPQERPIMIMNEVTEYPPDAVPTRDQELVAQALVDRCFEAAKRHRWFQFANGIEQGYQLLHGDKRHYYKREYIFDDAILDCDRPEFLMYYDTPQGKALAGLMFYVARPLDRGPQIGGPLTIWHYHVWAPVQCLIDDLLLIDQADENGHCPEGRPGQSSPEMLHVWLMDRPKGPFTTTMYLRKGEVETLTEKRAAPSIKVASTADAQ